MAISPPSPEPGIVPYEIVVLADGKPVSTKQDQWFITRHPPKLAVGPGSGALYSLDGRSGWPSFLETPHIAASKEGLSGLGTHCLRTKSGHYLAEDFTFDVVFSIVKDDPITYVGLGEGRAVDEYIEPENSVQFRIRSPGRYKGEVTLSKETRDRGEAVGRVPNPGTHRATITKQGNTVTFAIDIDNDGDTPDDIQSTIPNIGDFAPFLHGKNGYIFFGGDAVFHKFELVSQNYKSSTTSETP